MDQLTGTDHASIFSERRNVHNHVAMLCIYDATTAPGGKVRYKDILEHFADRLYLHPVFRRKLVNVPLGLDRPYWVTGADIDVEYHIRHIALPAPGDWRQLMIQVARLHSRPLDRAHPLWEAYVIEGLDNIPNLPPGAFAVFLKIHHAAVDGMAAAHLMQQLHTETPTFRMDKKSVPFIVERLPGGLELAMRSLSNVARRIGQMARISNRVGRQATKAGIAAVEHAISERSLPKFGSDEPTLKVLNTRFKSRVSPHRVVEGFGMPLSRIKRIRDKLPGITLNDVFIAVAGGGVRKYLEAKKELPTQTLRGLMPISLRADASAGGNDVAAVPVPVCSDIADPIARLHAVHDGTRKSKANAETVGLDLLKQILDVLPPPVVNLALEKLMLPGIDMAVSNVRGPDKAMYLAGAKAMCLYPVSIPTDGVGLNVTGISYNRVMWVSIVSCRSMLPDSGFFLQCMRDSWQELLGAADALPVPNEAALVKAGGRKTAGTRAKTQSRQRRLPA